MNISELGLMSDEEFGKMLKNLSGEKDKNKEPRWAEHKNNETTASSVNSGYVTSRPVPSVQMANGKMQRRTEKTLMKAAIERGLHIGTKARIERRSIGKDGSWILREVEEGTVIGICAHFFTVQIDAHRECFSWNEWAGDDHTKVRFHK